MRFFKVINNGYITMIGTGEDGTEITQAEYDDILAIIRHCPKEKNAYFKLKADKTWEKFEISPDNNGTGDEEE